MKQSHLLYAVAASLLIGACADDGTSPIPTPSMSATEVGLANTYLVRFKGNIPSSFDADVAALGGEVIFAHAGVGIAAVEGLTASGAQALAANSAVAAVDEDAYVELEAADALTVEAAAVEDAVQSAANPATAFFYPRQWHMRAINAQGAWAAGKLGSASVRVGILDTGLSYNTPDLNGRVDLALSKSFLSAAENARVQTAFPGAHTIADLNYHGTHVGSTVVSNGIVGAGVTSGITLVGLKVCTPGTAANGWRGSCPTSGTLAAILYAADLGIPILNMSLGGTFNRRDGSAQGGFGPSFLATINQVFSYANRKGSQIIVSAGNSALDIDHDGNGYKTYCSAPHVICVSATGPTAQASTNGPWTNVDALSYYSNYGRSGISVAAPGGNASAVWATCSRHSLAIPVCQTGNFIVGVSGTSMAAPHTSGVAALAASNGAGNPAQIRAAVESGADDLGDPGTDPAYGKGRINAARTSGAL
jgi:lantibiotic leader peptide-processing serine protease